MPKKPKWNEQPCPQCKEPVSFDASRCPHCTTVFSEALVKSRKDTHDFSQKFGLGCVGIIAVPVLIYFAFFREGNSNYSVSQNQEIAELAESAKFLPPSTEGVAFDVPSHPTGRYRLLRWKRMSNGHIEATTRQDSQYGTVITRSEIDCKKRRIWSLGQGETEEQALRDQGRAPTLRLIEGSITDVKVTVVCREAKK
jgi:hypothetical protein